MTTSPQQVPVPGTVVIVGAGPVGVTAATLLGQYGVECLVLDRWDGIYPQPRAVHLDDEVYRILARLGISEEFAAVTRPALGLRLVDPDHRVLAVFHREGSRGRHGYPQANMFDQPELEQLLRAGLEDQPSVRMRSNVVVTGVAQDGPDRVRVDYTDELTGAHESVTATYVLGCDGANSAVRTAIGSTMEDLRFEQRWLVLDVASEVDFDQWEGVHQVCDPRRAATYMRIGTDRYRWEFQLLEEETAADYQTIDALLPLIAPWVAGVAEHELRVVRVAEYTFRAQIADRWRDRNVFILGDAAHLTPPFIGQGLCAGLRDAMNLSWKLAGVLRGDLQPSVLDSYEAERKPHARAMIKLAKVIGAAMTRGGRAGNGLRHVIAPRLHLVPGLGGRLLDGETPPLHRSALVQRGWSRRGLAGSLCPNASLEDGRRLDDVGATGFLLVTTATPTAEQRRRLARRGARLLEVTPTSPLGTWLARGNAAGAVVRPDYTVLLAGNDLAALTQAVPRFSPRKASAGESPRRGEVVPPCLSRNGR